MLAERLVPAVPPPSGRPAEFNLAPRDVTELKPKLKAHQRLFAGCFRRKEQRYWAHQYMQGQMLELEHKAIAPMARELQHGNIQAMQQFIGEGAWSDLEALRVNQRLMAEVLGDPEGVLILDGCDFPKQGDDSVGVAWQYCGPLGKLANCQASVVLAYASERGHTLLDARLYVPEEWFDDAHRERREQCGVPEDLAFLTKPELGWSMLKPLIEAGEVPFGWIAMDEGYGANTPLLDAIAAKNRRYFAEVPRSLHVWRRRPRVLPPATTGRQGGRPGTRPRLAPTAPATHRIDQIAQTLPAKSWRAFIIHEGSKGPLAVEIAALRVVTVADRLPGREEWLVIRRPSARAPLKDWKFYRSNAAADVPVKTLARLTAWRWPVETTNEECKQELGWDDYEVRGWTGWHHHTTMTILSHGFLVKLRVELGAKAPALTVSQVRRLLQVVLPRREWDEAGILAEIQRLQERNHAAYRSHRKRQLRVIRLRGQPSRRPKRSTSN